ncbi:conserved hypothetical protein [Mesorhizobium plurifarium]|uniref:Class II aldolase/adducin N-terminal domain-containing protein n=1 Tax=Mesorhizobium plurifarium TaxID=69974 RepID=A0A090F2G2_MESPL|nr:conserved hypothetical protein [Mesorhizobium plurifarium]
MKPGVVAISCPSERELRVDLAAALRLAAKFDWHESVGNHFSCAVSPDGKTFLLNPKWKHFLLVKASDLLLLDAEDAESPQSPNGPDATAWCIHSALHSKLSSARVVFHAHPPYCTALASLRDPVLKSVDQITARFNGLVGIDLEFGGMADDPGEALRLANAFGTRPILLMGNHGVTVTAQSIPEAFEHLYLLERAAKNLMLAYASGQPISVMSPEIARKTAESWQDYTGMAYAHFEQLKQIFLDKDDPSYME